MPRELIAKPVLDARAVLGEGPVWDCEQAVLYWVDIVRGQVHRFHPDSGRDEAVFLEKTVGSVAMRTKGGLVAALADGFYLLPDIADASALPFCLPDDLFPGQRFNDGKCDPAGRFWAGTMQTAADGPKGALYCLETDGTCRSMVRDIGCSNGLVWTNDGRILYYIDTLTCHVDAFDFDNETGAIANRRTVIDFASPDARSPGSPPPGIPDGMTCDVEGMLWIAEWKGYKVSRWNPRTGRKIGEVILPVSKVTSCTFGGTDWSTLFITTASEGMTPAEKRSQPHSGAIFQADTDTKGYPPVRFEG